jgi:hypothetical protein
LICLRHTKFVTFIGRVQFGDGDGKNFRKSEILFSHNAAKKHFATPLIKCHEILNKPPSE